MIRTTNKTVTFAGAFALSGLDGLQPAGAYEIATDEELVENLSFIAYRRVATLMTVRRNGATELIRVDPAELDALLLQDAGLTVLPPSQGGAPGPARL